MARGLPWLKQGLPYLAVCLELLSCLAAALALLCKVHLANGKMFLRKKKAKQRFLDLMSENSDTTLSPLPAAFISHVMLFAAKYPLKEKYEGHSSPWWYVWSQRQSQGSTLEHMELGQHHPSTGKGHMVPAWTPVLPLCFTHGILLTQMQRLPSVVLPLLSSTTPIFDWLSYMLRFTQVLQGWAWMEDEVEGLRSPFAWLQTKCRVLFSQLSVGSHSNTFNNTCKSLCCHVVKQNLHYNILPWKYTSSNCY